MKDFISFENLFRTENSPDSKRPAEIKCYQQAMDLVSRHAAAAQIMKERLFIRILFSWLTTNASAHMLNSGLVKTNRGDYVLAPAFGILCTRMHELCEEFGLSGGLFEGDKNTPEFREYGHYTANEFTAFGMRSGIPVLRIEKIYDFFRSKKTAVINLTDLSFLPVEAKNIFKFNFMERLARLA